MPNTLMRLLISVVRRGRGDTVVELARSAGAVGSTVTFGKGTAQSKFLRLLCLADVEKELVFTVAPAAIMAKIKAALREAPNLCVKTPGIGIILDVSNFFRFGAVKPQAIANSPIISSSSEAMENMDQKTDRSLLFIVVNSGLADELIDVARKAGATGGTILRARGTVKGEDASFFGIVIVPEKEILLILVTRDQEENIVNAIKNSAGLDQPGVGILFSLPVEDFFPLGKKNNS